MVQLVTRLILTIIQRNVDINFVIRISNETPDILVEYNSLKFERDSIERLTTHFINVLTQVENEISIKISELCLINDHELNYYVKSLNQRILKYDETVLAHQLFENIAAKYPDRVAIECEGMSLSYRELNERANQYAWILRRKGDQK